MSGLSAQRMKSAGSTAVGLATALGREGVDVFERISYEVLDEAMMREDYDDDEELDDEQRWYPKWLCSAIRKGDDQRHLFASCAHTLKCSFILFCHGNCICCLVYNNTVFQAPFLASFVLFFAASLCMTIPTNVPTTPRPRIRTMAGKRIAQTRGGKSDCIDESDGKSG